MFIPHMVSLVISLGVALLGMFEPLLWPLKLIGAGTILFTLWVILIRTIEYHRFRKDIRFVVSTDTLSLVEAVRKVAYMYQFALGLSFHDFARAQQRILIYAYARETGQSLKLAKHILLPCMFASTKSWWRSLWPTRM